MVWPWVESRPFTMTLSDRNDLGSIVRGLVGLPLPGSGRTDDRFATLAEVAAFDLSSGRLAEGHADAVAILDEGDHTVTEGIWGVWAADPASVRAKPDGTGWSLQGRKPWCSGATMIDHALCTAMTPDGPRLFVVDLSDPGIVPMLGTWPAVGMAGSDTLDVAVDISVSRDAVVGAPGWYTERPGFWFGSIGVAACWLGGAVGAVRALAGRMRDRGGDEHQLANLGAAAARCATLALGIEGAARWIDNSGGDINAARTLAWQTRHVAEEVCLAVLVDVGRGGGADQLSHDADQARRVADLPVYIRQHKAGRDAAALGRVLLGGDLR
jgi:alkylation response protein AidB-like acyl-CoA dehydrogenase